MDMEQVMASAFFLNVHEGPQSISPINSNKSRQEFLPGMITSDEPGFYLTNEYGIRIENLNSLSTLQKNRLRRILSFRNTYPFSDRLKFSGYESVK